ncbi:SRPBCC family protein [Dyadobacter sandarakinus]|uniref:SRPBCC domain-containing protein n=1 Tax=Dyadobacter sandarakinus TaxID=2747268 RepID=A0ABX7I1F8_9BACT|nr:SRPBCC family protein [Dyadobacter sandarakinus]QRQ99873.1 SRPBCC domain-containing protein [Dyadobacter sandarakinus]
MESPAQKITVQTEIQAPVEKVWEMFSGPEHITQWNAASDDWHSPHAENDLRPGGSFKTLMAARDGSYSFDFAGEYVAVEEHRLIEYNLGDGRNVKLEFTSGDGSTKLVETFDPERTNPIEMQQNGWQSILDNFKKYVESH